MILPAHATDRRTFLRVITFCLMATPTTTGQTASQPTELQLHDWALHPRVVEQEADAPPQRIVSGAPNVTEICCALGLIDQLVGRTRYCNYPPAVRDVPAFGALIDTNVEVLLKLKPDLILLAGQSRALTERLARQNLRLVSLPDRSLNDIFTAIKKVGTLTHRPQTAEMLCHAIRADLDRVTDRFAGTPPARVLLLIGTLSDPPMPPFVAGPGSFYDDLLKRAGHTNVVAEHGAMFAPLSLEFILRADPDVIIELDPDGRARPQGDADALRAWNKVGPLQAVAKRRVHVLTGQQYYLAGPRIAQTYRALCQAIAGSPDE